jgi:hypothetical protein
MAKLMNGQLSMFHPETSEGSSSAISLPASEGGVTHSGSLVGLTIGTSGQEAVPASPGAQRGRALRPPIRATFGLRGSSSFASASLQSSLANRLRARLAGRGSIVFTTTWKCVTTPSHRSIYRLAASARSTGVNVCTSWPTPCAQPANGEPEAFLERKRRAVARGKLDGRGAHGSPDGRQDRVLADTESDGCRQGRQNAPRRDEGIRPEGSRLRSQHDSGSRMADTDSAFPSEGRLQRSWPELQSDRDASVSPWTPVEWLECRDGKARPIEPGLEPLAHGLPARLVRLRGYGNAINPWLASEFIQAYVEATGPRISTG